MKLIMLCPTWGLPSAPLREQLSRVVDAGYDGIETGVPLDAEGRDALAESLAEFNLQLVAQQWSFGNDPAEHAAVLELQLRNAALLRPLLINCHSGRDHFQLAQNQSILQRAEAVAAELSQPIAHETHRGRFSFSTMSTRAHIEALPELRLTADLSHWCCVHESLLADQPGAVAMAVEHAVHIHARVGHAQGPQVSDPRAPEWQEAVATHLGWWKRIADLRRKAGHAHLTVTPEFGPAESGYLPLLPHSREPVADPFELNAHMRQLLCDTLTGS